MKLPETKLWSFVHENGDTEEENPTPYKHTHVFVLTTDEDASQVGRVVKLMYCP